MKRSWGEAFGKTGDAPKMLVCQGLAGINDVSQDLDDTRKSQRSTLI
jgi:hypothetical protein